MDVTHITSIHWIVTNTRNILNKNYIAENGILRLWMWYHLGLLFKIYDNQPPLDFIVTRVKFTFGDMIYHILVILNWHFVQKHELQLTINKL